MHCTMPATSSAWDSTWTAVSAMALMASANLRLPGCRQPFHGQVDFRLLYSFALHFATALVAHLHFHGLSLCCQGSLQALTCSSSRPSVAMKPMPCQLTLAESVHKASCTPQSLFCLPVVVSTSSMSSVCDGNGDVMFGTCLAFLTACLLRI